MKKFGEGSQHDIYLILQSVIKTATFYHQYSHLRLMSKKKKELYSYYLFIFLVAWRGGGGGERERDCYNKYLLSIHN